jgi:hypothetical protein
MAFLENKIVRRVLLVSILIWGGWSFYYINQANTFLVILMSAAVILSLYSIWQEYSVVFNLIFLSFIATYAFNVFFSQLNIPFALIMVGVLTVFGFLFIYTEQKIGILGNKRLIYLVLFSLIIAESFFTMSYFLLNPITSSLVIATISYLFVGYCYTVIAKHEDNKFFTYVFFTILSLAVIFLTSKWSGLV